MCLLSQYSSNLQRWTIMLGTCRTEYLCYKLTCEGLRSSIFCVCDPNMSPLFVTVTQEKKNSVATKNNKSNSNFYLHFSKNILLSVYNINIITQKASFFPLEAFLKTKFSLKFFHLLIVNWCSHYEKQHGAFSKN